MGRWSPGLRANFSPHLFPHSGACFHSVEERNFYSFASAIVNFLELSRFSIVVEILWGFIIGRVDGVYHVWYRQAKEKTRTFFAGGGSPGWYGIAY